MIEYAQITDLKALSALDGHISPEELRRSVESSRVLIARSGKTIIGWLRFGMFWDNTPFMNMLYVSEEFRGRGYGTALCDLWEDEMLRVGFETVLTSTLSNERGQFFYRKRGYRDCGSLILPNEPLEIILMKELSPCR